MACSVLSRCLATKISLSEYDSIGLCSKFRKIKVINSNITVNVRNI